MQRYRAKISGPLLDRIDIHVEVPRPDRLPDARNHPRPESSAVVRRRVIEAREWQLKRNGVPNALLRGKALRTHCTLEPVLRDFLEEAAQRMGLSPRGCQRVLKVARTVADLDGAAKIGGGHLAEALAYRGMDGGNG